MERRFLLIAGIACTVLISGFTFFFVGSFFFTDNIQRITLATTTSTENSGLLDYIHPEFTKDTGIMVDVVAVGTGAALEQGRRGLADVVIVHARTLENQFISEGYGIHRVDLMYNYFVIIGPAADPADIRGLANSTEVFTRIYEARDQITFVSRGDNSGTHVKEKSLWNLSNITIDTDNLEWVNANPWYVESGLGMGPTLLIASTLQAYTLTDIGTWLFTEDNLNLEILADESELWINPYSAILINHEKFNPGIIKEDLAKRYVQWLISPKGQEIIDNYTIGDEKLFYSDFMNHINEMPQEELDFWGIETNESMVYWYEELRYY